MRHSIPGLVLVLVIAAGCNKGPVVPSPLTGQTRYLCCNLRYERPTITDVNYQVGTLVPAGTTVQILEVRANSVQFQPAGHPVLTLKYEWGRKANVPFETFLDRLFLEQDPRVQLAARPRRAAPAAKKGAPKGPQPPNAETVQEMVQHGEVAPGMTREQVLMSLGYPPAHRTPSLDANEWYYWRNRWKQFVVVFDGNTVLRVAEE